MPPNPLRPAQLGFAASALAIDDTLLASFAARFADALFEHAVLTVPFTLDRLGVTLRADGPFAANAIRGFLLEAGLPEAEDGALADLLESSEAEPVEVTFTASQQRPLHEVVVGLVGDWSRRRAWEALPGLGIHEETRLAWDRLCGAWRPRELLRLDVAFGEEGRWVEVGWGQLTWRESAAEWGAQLRHAAGRTGVPADQAAWLGALFQDLCRAPATASTWTMFLRPDRVEPRVRVTWAGAPMALVLHLAGDLAGPEDLGTRLGALAAAADLQDDIAWRLMVEVGEGARPRGGLSLRLHGP